MTGLSHTKLNHIDLDTLIVYLTISIHSITYICIVICHDIGQVLWSFDVHPFNDKSLGIVTETKGTGTSSTPTLLWLKSSSGSSWNVDKNKGVPSRVYRLRLRRYYYYIWTQQVQTTLGVEHICHSRWRRQSPRSPISFDIILYVVDKEGHTGGMKVLQRHRNRLHVTHIHIHTCEKM